MGEGLQRETWREGGGSGVLRDRGLGLDFLDLEVQGFAV